MILGDESTAYYRVSFLIALIVISLREIVDTVIRPRVSKSYAGARLAADIRSFIIPYRLALAIGLVYLIVFMVFGESLLSRFFGQEYVAAYWPAGILVFGKVLSLAFGPVGILLNMTGNENSYFRIIVFSLGIAVILNVLLVPVYGIEGAAFSSVISGLFMWATTAIFIRDRLKFSVLNLYFLREKSEQNI